MAGLPPPCKRITKGSESLPQELAAIFKPELTLNFIETYILGKEVRNCSTINEKI